MVSLGQIPDYVPLGDYAMIGDCRTAALVSKQGSIDWLCLPDFSSPSVFAKLLDAGQGGAFSVTIANLQESTRLYRENTTILETTLRSSDGIIRITDCIPVAVSTPHACHLAPMREILRKVEVLEGNPTLQVTLDARFDYAARQAKFRQRGKLGWAAHFRQQLLNLVSDFPLALMDGKLTGSSPIKSGDVYWFSLTFEAWRPAILEPLGSDAEERIERTAAWWRAWCDACRYQGPYRVMVLRSAITLRMLTFTASGALLAAATTSLPEQAQGWMNWDYRYCWPRDAALTLAAFIDCGWREEANAFFGWLMNAAKTTRPGINVVYDIYGRNHLRERSIKLAGYKGAQPVRIGNKAAKQIQHDVYGEVLLAVEDWIAHYGAPPTPECKALQGFGRAVQETWREPDFGIWEIRDKPRHYVYSKVMAWYVFDCLIRLHEKKAITIPLDDYKKERDELRARIEQEGYDAKRNTYVSAFGEDAVDASLLLLPRCGYVAYDDPKMLGTWDVIQRDLQVGDLVRRYPSDYVKGTAGECALIICNFWVIDFLTCKGDRKEAQRRLDYLMSLANDVGLYNEGIDLETMQAAGNMPQAFSHAGLINSVLKLYAGKDRGCRAA